MKPTDANTKTFVLAKTFTYYVHVDAKTAREAIKFAEKNVSITADVPGDVEEVVGKWDVYGVSENNG